MRFFKKIGENILGNCNALNNQKWEFFCCWEGGSPSPFIFLSVINKSLMVLFTQKISSWEKDLQETLFLLAES